MPKKKSTFAVHSTTVTVRLSIDDAKKLLEKAKSKGFMNFSEYLRAILRLEAQK